MKFTVESDREKGGRWIASVPELPGVDVYGESLDRALSNVVSLASTALADEVEQGERDAETLLGVTIDVHEAA